MDPSYQPFDVRPFCWCLRRTQLEAHFRLFEFFHDCEELEAWLYERLLKLQTTGLGRDLNHIQVAQQKHKVRHLDLDVAAWSLTKSLYLFKSTAAHYYCLVLFWVLWVFVSLTLQLPFHLVVPLFHVLLHCPHSIFFIPHWHGWETALLWNPHPQTKLRMCYFSCSRQRSRLRSLCTREFWLEGRICPDRTDTTRLPSRSGPEFCRSSGTTWVMRWRDVGTGFRPPPPLNRWMRVLVFSLVKVVKQQQVIC